LQVAARLPEATYARLRAMAREGDRSIAAEVRRAIEAHVAANS
jgi:predicted DNA-binding protein